MGGEQVLGVRPAQLTQTPRSTDKTAPHHRAPSWAGAGHHCSATGLCAAFPLHCEPERAWLEQHWGRWGLLWQCGGGCAGVAAGAEEGGGACSQPLDIVQRYYGSAIAL
eukprot:COSAG01_NODE_9641_length_2382_cov_1.837057_2_plen_109_part_00